MTFSYMFLSVCLPVNVKVLTHLRPITQVYDFTVAPPTKKNYLQLSFFRDLFHWNRITPVILFLFKVQQVQNSKCSSRDILALSYSSRYQKFYVQKYLLKLIIFSVRGFLWVVF